MDERRNLGIEIIRLLMDDWVKKFQKDGTRVSARKHERAFFERLPKTSSVLFEHPVAGNGRVLLKVDDLEGTSVERDVFPKWFVDHALSRRQNPSLRNSVRPLPEKTQTFRDLAKWRLRPENSRREENSRVHSEKTV